MSISNNKPSIVLLEKVLMTKPLSINLIPSISYYYSIIFKIYTSQNSNILYDNNISKTISSNLLYYFSKKANYTDSIKYHKQLFEIIKKPNKRIHQSNRVNLENCAIKSERKILKQKKHIFFRVKQGRLFFSHLKGQRLSFPIQSAQRVIPPKTKLHYIYKSFITNFCKIFPRANTLILDESYNQGKLFENCFTSHLGRFTLNFL